MTTGPIWITAAGFLSTLTELISTSTQVIASGTNVSYRFISGTVPSGIIVSSTGTISGIPSAVLQPTTYNFVVRATSTEGFADRTFNFVVKDSQPPTWNTSTGYSSIIDYNTSTAYLKLGPKGESFTLNKQYVYYQFQAEPTSAPSDTSLKFYIPENGGNLPPGLTLTKDGILSGFMNDTLTFDGLDEDLGGYDEEKYDAYAYDYGQVEVDSIGVPKIYTFKVTASDNVRSTDRFFKILVVNPEMIRNPERIQMSLEPGLISTNTNYIPSPQFIKGSDLGIARAENNETFDISAYDGYPLLGSVIYTLTTGSTLLTRLPNNLQLEPNEGILYGYIPYQPAYTTNYSLTINAEKWYQGTGTIAVNTFTLAVKGNVESSIEWVSSSTLESLYPGQPSELSVQARQLNSDFSIKYSLVDGTIPPGLTLERDGSLSGSIDYGTTGTYSFTIKAQDVYELSAIQRQFTLAVTTYDNNSYTKIWTRPFLSLDKRTKFRDFMLDTFTFPQSSMYRFFDPNFGVQTEIKMILEFGIQQQNLADYIPAFRENFYKRRFTFGNVKMALAKTTTGTVVYEVVYVDIVDNMERLNENNELQSVNNVIYSNDQIYYPSSIHNMRRQLSQLTLNNNDFINIDEFMMPRFMRSPQLGQYEPPGYMHVVPLCYTLPGQGDTILKRIKLSNFNFNQFDLEIDRIIVDKSLDNTTAKYLLFPRKNITDSIQSDSILYVFDETPLETDTNEAITRE